MTHPVSDPQQPADSTVQPGITPAGPEFEVYTPPAFVPPQQQPVAEAPVAPKPRKTGVIVLTVLLVLLFGATGALGVLFAQETDRTADLSKQVEGKDREIADLNRKVKESKEDATRAADLQKQAEAAQKKAENDAVSAQKCREAAKSLTESLVANDRGKGEAAIGQLLIQC
ncbi:hypothetical protein [Lentzea nigeriaca]|uniref:hypothetical protein n=1 Tax=Lentzea nigeriaca TaxID=1128665 RepID=UPI00195645E3|nr:hypothetical protein [Lentzea nigeriaca]MBM7862915.1 uncharacterized protein HemX [Lentzea nigeriaca]